MRPIPNLSPMEVACLEKHKPWVCPVCGWVCKEGTIFYPKAYWIVFDPEFREGDFSHAEKRLCGWCAKEWRAKDLAEA